MFYEMMMYLMMMVMIRTRVVDMAGRGDGVVHLAFSLQQPSAVSAGEMRQVYLFLNSDAGENEECFLFRVSYGEQNVAS